MAFQVKTEKMIARPAGDVFRALKEGRLFMNCSGDSSSMKIDFRVGGKYHIDFKTHGVTNSGEFLEIIPNKRVVFSWCQDFGAEQKPDTQVTIELFDDGPKTRIVLTHTGFRTQEIRDEHDKGWNGGITDLGEELQSGRLRFVRDYQVPVAKLYETCKNPASFFAIMGDLAKGTVDFKVGGKYHLPTKKGEIKGEFLEIVPDQKIAFSWLSGCDGPLLDSKVTLIFNQKADGSSSLELIHEGLKTDEDQMRHRQGWEFVTEKIRDGLGKGPQLV